MGLFQEQLYTLDTSAIIELDKKFPSDKPIYKDLWKELTLKCKTKNILQHRLFFSELERYEGKESRHTEWAKSVKRHCLIAEDVRLIANGGIVFDKLKKTPFIRTKKYLEGKEELDPWLIAVGLTYDCKVVTKERFDEKALYKIPWACREFKVECIDIDDFIGELGFALKK